MQQQILRHVGIGLLAVILLFQWKVRNDFIDMTVPYPRGGIDEVFVAEKSLNIIVTGDLNPHSFEYPSLPIYLTALGMSLGFFSSASHLEVRNVREIRSVGFPFYRPGRVMRFARYLFSFISMVGFVLMCAISFRLYDQRAVYILTAIFLSLSSTYILYSWSYINPNILGVVFGGAAVLSLLQTRRGILWMVIVPGIFSGLTIASKYNFGLILCPYFLWAIFYRIPPRFVLGYFVTVILTFVVSVPYSILDVPTFLNDVGVQIYHYQSAHLGHTVDAGRKHLAKYVVALLNESGYALLAFAVLGIVAAIRRDWKRTTVVLAFPLSLLLYMSSQKVFFVRNILPVYAWFAVFLAVGVFAAYQWLVGVLAERVSWFNERSVAARAAAACALLLLILVTLPYQPLKNAYGMPKESRNVVKQWIREQLPAGSTILVEQMVGFDSAGLESYNVVAIDVASAKLVPLEQARRAGKEAFVLYPRFGHDGRKPGGKEVAERYNRFYESVKPVREFGGLHRDALVNYRMPLPSGDPHLYLGRVGPRDGPAAAVGQAGAQ